MDGLAFDDMDEFGRELDDPFEELVQDVVHLLLEAYGSNPDALTRGAGLTGALSGPDKRIPTIRAQIESQLHDDTRLSNATVSIQPTDTRGSYRVDLVLTVNGDELGVTLLTDSAGGVRRVS